MFVKDQCCTAEQAKRLKALGVAQDSLYYHTFSDWGILPKKSIDFSGGGAACAYTVAELGKMLPEYLRLTVPSGKKAITLNHLYMFKHHTRGHIVAYHPARKGVLKQISCEGTTEAQARAAMVIYLLENKLLTIDECNKAYLN